MEMETMPAAEMKKLLSRRAGEVERYLAGLPGHFAGTPQRLADAMQYSLEAGGKRLRPVLCLSCARLCGLAIHRALPFAAAVEMIHTYSLIHDDLPAMDNDDLRRGRPSSHKAFDEATAILAGDALLTDAFAVIASMDLSCGHVLRALAELAQAAGSSGMVGGQMLDMAHTGKKDVTFAELKHMQALKTGAMLKASCVCGALLAGAAAEPLEMIGAYGAAIGRAFQIVDDILNVTGNEEDLGKPVGSDDAAGKNTYPSMIGLAESRSLALEAAMEAKKAISHFSGPEAAFLLALADYTIQRAD